MSVRVIFSAVVLLGLVSFALTRCNKPGTATFFSKSNALSEAAALHPATLDITTWNLGYGGLGKESDFRMDGGNMLRAPSKDVVVKNVAGIVSRLKKTEANVFFFQEISRPSYLNHRTDLIAPVLSTLSRFSGVFQPDFKVCLPGPFGIEAGLATFQDFETGDVEIIELELEKRRFALRKHYKAILVRTERGGVPWSLINIHLSAFDQGAVVRRKQLRSIIELAKREYEGGRFVVVGGDFNFEINPSSVPHRTPQQYLTWLHKYPEELVPADWHYASSNGAATFRTLNQPFVHGENFVGFIDGFLISPNLKINSVHGIETGFEFTDHNPVSISVSTIVSGVSEG